MSDDDGAALVDRWFASARMGDVDLALRRLLNDIGEAIDARQPRCTGSGRCCRFEAFDHRLFVTGLEAAWTLLRVGRRLGASEIDHAHRVGACPFLVGDGCSIHGVKPAGCRLFYCDESAAEWMRDLAADVHQRVRSLHAAHDVPYRYEEWRSLLARFVKAGEVDADHWPLMDEPLESAQDVAHGRFVPLRIHRP